MEFKKIKIAVAGLGRIGKIHLDNLLQNDNVEVVAVSDPLEISRTKAMEKGIHITFVSYYEMLEATNIDAIVICSPTDTHADYVEYAAKKGLHIFCEKPLDLTLQRVKEVLHIVKMQDVKLMLGFNRRFDKEFKKVKELIQKNAIGDIHLVKTTSRDPGAPPIDYIKRSGGLFLDMAIHDFDMARFIVGSEVREVYATGAAMTNPEIGKVGDIDTAITILTFYNGVKAVIDNSREASYGYDQRLEVFGSKGMIQANNNFQDAHQLFDANGTHSSLPLHFFLERYEKAYKNEMLNFIECMASGMEMPVTGVDGLKSLQIGLAAKKSISEGRPVAIGEIDE